METKTRRGLFFLISELRRRKVCRAATMYFVAMWVICQIVDIIAPSIGLPQWTLSLVVILGLIGFPLAIVCSWLFDITPDGVVTDDVDGSDRGAGNAGKGTFGQVLDCSLLIAALIIGTQLAFGLTGVQAATSSPTFDRVTITPFRAAGNGEAEGFALNLAAELQHELLTHTAVTVIHTDDSLELKDTMRLTGSIAFVDGYIVVAVTVVHPESKEVVWSDMFRRAGGNRSTNPQKMARDIVSALQLQRYANRIGNDIIPY